MKKDEISKALSEVLVYVGDSVIGPSVSALLDRFVIKNASEPLVAFIYFLGFLLSAFKIYQSVKIRKLRFLERMVYRKQKKSGKEMEGGIIDENSVKMAEALTKL